MAWFLPLIKALAGKGAAGGAVKGATGMAAKGAGTVAKGGAMASRAAPIAARAPATSSMASALKPGAVQGAQTPGLMVKPSGPPAQLGPTPTQSGPSMIQRMFGGDPKAAGGEQNGMMQQMMQGGGGGDGGAAEEQARADALLQMSMEELRSILGEQRMRQMMGGNLPMAAQGSNPYLTGRR